MLWQIDCRMKMPPTRFAAFQYGYNPHSFVESASCIAIHGSVKVVREDGKGLLALVLIKPNQRAVVRLSSLPEG
jgi:hypothetical protein